MCRGEAERATLEAIFAKELPDQEPLEAYPSCSLSLMLVEFGGLVAKETEDAGEEPALAG
jgi:hypothetical protein